MYKPGGHVVVSGRKFPISFSPNLFQSPRPVHWKVVPKRRMIKWKSLLSMCWTVEPSPSASRSLPSHTYAHIHGSPKLFEQLCVCVCVCVLFFVDTKNSRTPVNTVSVVRKTDEKTRPRVPCTLGYWFRNEGIKAPKECLRHFQPKPVRWTTTRRHSAGR
jgi:hypothetical protein